MSNAIKPKHYQSKIEPIDFILANNLNFIEGNIIKYVIRYKKKNGLEDLLKAKDYLEKLINEVKNEKNEVIDNNKETTTYNITNRSDLQMFYDYENDYQIWIVKAVEGIFAFSVGKQSKEFIIKILKKQAELSPWLKNILSFLPHISLIYIFYTTEDCPYFYHNHMSINRTFKTTDGIISEGQRKRLFAISKESLWTQDNVKDYIKSHGFESTKDISTAKYDMICDYIKSFPKTESVQQ